MSERPQSLFGKRVAAANLTAGRTQSTPDLSYRGTAARNWNESKPRIQAMESRHSAYLGLLRQQGYPEDHPGVQYHRDMLGKVQRERAHYDGVLEGREPKTPTIENAMVRRAWAHEGEGPDADDS
jgi:hypothetical protein